MDCMSRVSRAAVILVSVVAFLAPASGTPGAALARRSCPVFYQFSRHECYVTPTVTSIRQAERQMPVRVVDPISAAHQATSLPLMYVVVDRTRRETGKLHPWVITYMFGQTPDLGLPSATVTSSARFVAVGESVGRITLKVNGVNAYDKPQFRRIRVNGRGVPIWTLSVNLPRRNATLSMYSTLPKEALQRLVAALTR